MTPSRHPNRHLLARGHRITPVEVMLAISVIVGLAFVTLRVTAMPDSNATGQTAAVNAEPPAEAEAEAARTAQNAAEDAVRGGVVKTP